MNQERKVYDEIHKSYNIKEGVIKINTGNTEKHELAKFLVCLEIAKNGGKFLTEVIWKNKSRSDVVDLNPKHPLIIEITHTEKPDGHKEEDYPLHIIYLKAEDVIKHWRMKND